MILRFLIVTFKNRSLFLFKIYLVIDMARKIVVTSGKGGVGKTTVVANLGVALSNLGQRVLLVDVDFGLNNLDVVLGVEGKVCYDICDVIEGRCRIKQALIQCAQKKNLFVMPSGNANNTTNIISGQSIRMLIDDISHVFDYVLIDCPAGIDVGFHRAVACADEAFIVATPNVTSLRDADKVVSVLSGYELENVGLIVNRARGDLILNEKMMMPSDVSELLKVSLMGVLPEEDAVFLSSGYGLCTKTDSFKAYKILANNVHKGGKKMFDVTNKYSGLFGGIKRRLKGSL